MPADTTLETAIATIANLEEAIADLQQLALEDRGWDRLLAGAQDDLTPEGRRRIGDMCNVMTIANPLIKRGFQLRQRRPDLALPLGPVPDLPVDQAMGVVHRLAMPGKVPPFRPRPQPPQAGEEGQHRACHPRHLDQQSEEDEQRDGEQDQVHGSALRRLT